MKHDKKSDKHSLEPKDSQDPQTPEDKLRRALESDDVTPEELYQLLSEGLEQYTREELGEELDPEVLEELKRQIMAGFVPKRVSIWGLLWRVGLESLVHLFVMAIGVMALSGFISWAPGMKFAPMMATMGIYLGVSVVFYFIIRLFAGASFYVQPLKLNTVLEFGAAAVAIALSPLAVLRSDRFMIVIALAIVLNFILRSVINNIMKMRYAKRSKHD